MSRIYHLVTPAAWELSDVDYRPVSLAAEGFIHCSFAGQVAAAANRFYANADELALLHIDPDLLASPLRVEPSGSGEEFPHVYGPLNRTAVVAVQKLERGADGLWRFDP
jgi:uncharacterized protein (DUF952 family)